MELKTKNKNVILVFTTKKIVNIARSLREKNFEELYFKAINENDLDALSKIIYTFAEDEAGAHAFKTSEDVYEFLDIYKEENSKTYDDIYRELTEAINEEGFFRNKMSKEELTQRISDPLSGLDMNNLVKTSAEKAIAKIVESEAIAQA